jgi:hypothetical protein
MYTISVGPRSTMEVNIHNQCSNLKLTDRGCFSSGAGWNRYPDWEIDTGSMMRADLIPFLSTFKGVLTYQLQKEHVKPDDQSELPYIRLLMAWKSEGYKKFCMFIHLIECNKQINWNRIKLEEYYQGYASQLCTYTGPIKDTWLMHGGTVLMTRLELDFTQRDGVLNVTISEGVENEHTRIPIWIDLER